MIAILILFQFSNVSVIYTSEASINKYADTDITITASQTVQSEDLESKTAYSTAIIGNYSNHEANIAEEWCIYTKRTYYRFDSLEEYSESLSTRCSLLIANAGTVNKKKDVNILVRQSKTGITIILTSLPDVSFIRSSNAFRQLLGIRGIYMNTFTPKAITMYEGFLLGGKTTYRKLKKTVPYFRLRSGTKTYVVGEIRHQKKKKVKNEDLPPIVWRNQTENSFVFVVNCDFFQDHTGLGMLTSMFSETQEYLIYPIVNAQNVVCHNFPYTSNENNRTIKAQYYHSSKSLCENVLWPDVVSILEATNDKFTGMIAPKLEYRDETQQASSESLAFYLEQNEQISGELGISGDQMDSYTYYEEKIKYDTEFMKKELPEYTFTIFAPGDMSAAIYRKYLDGTEGDSILSSIRTLVLNNEVLTNRSILDFYNETIVSMAKTNDGFSHTNEEDLYLRSIETALGYSSVSLDFTRILYPKTKKDDWTRLSRDLSRYLETYWAEFRNTFDQLTVSESDKRVRKFFALDYTTHRRNDTINLTITNFNQKAYFLLNLNNERIVSAEGASFYKIEDGRYLISAKDTSVSIEVTTDSIQK